MTNNTNLIKLTLTIVATTAVVFNVQAQEDSIKQQSLKNVEVRGNMLHSHLNNSNVQTTVLDMTIMNDMPHILGNADPIHYVQTLPGVQTNGEFDAGIHIQGCDNQHNHIGIDGVPLYNVAHLLGFFSVFNASHFQQMLMQKTPNATAATNRLGGQIDMHVGDSLYQRTTGTLSVGPISSQGTLRLPTGSKSQLTLSARSAYLNLFYSQWMKIEEEELRYHFDDFNLTWMLRPNDANAVWVEAYYGHDKMGYENSHTGKGVNGATGEIAMAWQNAMGALHWKYKQRDLEVKNALYVTHFDNKLTYKESNLNAKLPSDITDYGYQGRLSYRRFNAGIEAIAHSIKPQSPDIEGMYTVDIVPTERQRTIEASLMADYTLSLGPLNANIGARATAYRYDNHNVTTSADPSLTLSYRHNATTVRLQAAVKHQYQFRVGFSNVGLPTECWFSADEHYHPQYSKGFSAVCETYTDNRMYRIEAEAYYKWLSNQVEYSGNLFDLIYNEYNIDNILLSGRGRNYGANLMVEKRRGKLTGWVSYSWARARRLFDGPDYRDWCPASHERPHELNVVFTYKIGGRWSFGGTYVLASGTPYTAPTRFYLISNNIISEFSEHNSNRLRPYRRLDLSANYDLSNKGNRRSGLNFSLYNVTMARNDLFVRLKIKDGQFANKPYRFMLPIMPSVNYYLHF